MSEEIQESDVIDLLCVTTKDLLPKTDIEYFPGRHPGVLSGFVGVRTYANFDLQEIVKNSTTEQFVKLVKERLIFAYGELAELATETVRQLEDTPIRKRWWRRK